MTATRTRPRPAIRLRAAPPLDPPYDDEVTLVAWLRGNSDQLELDLCGDGPVDSVRYRAPEQGGRPDRPESADGPPSGPRSEAVATASVEAQRAARRFLDTALEMLNGYRPVAHGRALTTPGLATGLVEQLRAATERLPQQSGRPGQPAAQRLRMLSLRVCEPRPGIAEAAAAIGNNGRTWALAFRLQRQRSRWIAVLVRLV